MLEQEDTFFSVAHGRLKVMTRSDHDSPALCVCVCVFQLRVQSGHAAAMLIQYHRPDKEGPKLSDYTIATTQASLCSATIHRAHYQVHVSNIRPQSS